MWDFVSIAVAAGLFTLAAVYARACAELDGRER